MTKEVLKLALEGFERIAYHKLQPDSVQTFVNHYVPLIKEALAQPKREPVPNLYVKDIDGNFHPYKEKGRTENCAAFGDDCSENHLPPSRFGVGKCNFIPKEILLSHLKRAEGAEEVTLPIDFFRDLLYQAMPRTWVGLDEEDDIDWEEGGNLKDLVKAIEAKLKEKNT